MIWISNVCIYFKCCFYNKILKSKLTNEEIQGEFYNGFKKGVRDDYMKDSFPGFRDDVKGKDGEEKRDENNKILLTLVFPSTCSVFK